MITGRPVKAFSADAADYNRMNDIFEREKIDGVIHFAGYQAIGESVAKPLMYYDNNINTVLTTLKVMKKHDVRKFVFSSSATVYGTPEKLPLSETMRTGCTNPYGWSKLMIERILSDEAEAGNYDVVLLRYFNPVGADESGLIGERPNGIPSNLMPYIS